MEYLTCTFHILGDSKYKIGRFTKQAVVFAYQTFQVNSSLFIRLYLFLFFFCTVRWDTISSCQSHASGSVFLFFMFCVCTGLKRNKYLVFFLLKYVYFKCTAAIPYFFVHFFHIWLFYRCVCTQQALMLCWHTFICSRRVKLATGERVTDIRYHYCRLLSGKHAGC